MVGQPQTSYYMRSIISQIALSVIICFLLVLSADAQKKQVQNAGVEQIIRKLDVEAAKAILDHDEKGIARYFAVNSVINNPRNGLTLGSAGLIETTKTGATDYYKFERVVESVQVIGNTAISMGQEAITMKNQLGGAGTIYLRRYTNVWMRSGTTWQIVARHSNSICN